MLYTSIVFYYAATKHIVISGVGGGQRPGDAAYNQSNTLEMYFKYVSSSVITHCGFNMHTFM